MICKFCGKDVPHLRYDPVTQAPIGCVECMPDGVAQGIPEPPMSDKNVRMYFTYGSCGHPYKGGWTVVEAPTAVAAIMLFHALHPANEETGLYPYCDYYTEDRFKKTEMYKHGNFGNYCHERIVVEVM